MNERFGENYFYQLVNAVNGQLVEVGSVYEVDAQPVIQVRCNSKLSCVVSLTAAAGCRLTRSQLFGLALVPQVAQFQFHVLLAPSPHSTTHCACMLTVVVGYKDLACCSCEPCAQGYYAPQNALACLKCPKNMFCPFAATQPFPVNYQTGLSCAVLSYA